MKILRVLLTIVLFVTCDLALARRVAVVNYDNVAIARADGKALTADEVKRIITAAATARGWNVKPGDNGTLTATFNKRGKHTAIVNLAYSVTSYSIKYRDSFNLGYIDCDKRNSVHCDNLNYEKGNRQKLIHSSYNDWVNDLMRAITAEARNNTGN